MDEDSGQVKGESDVSGSWHFISSQPFTGFCDDLEALEGLCDGGPEEEPIEGPSGAGDKAGDLDSVGSPSTLVDTALLETIGDRHVMETQHNTDVSQYNFDAALNVDFNSTTAEQPKQVWETGVWKYIFGQGDADLDFNVWGPQLSRPLPSAWGLEHPDSDVSVAALGKRSHSQSCNFMDVVSFKPEIPWREQREADLQRSIKLWIGVTCRWYDDCSLMLQLNQMQDGDEQFNMFAHIFSGRAPVTIRNRGNAILKICDYLEKQRLENFPMKELSFYRFLCSERMGGAPPSRLKGYLQAVTFCRHVFDMPELQSVIDSRRCKGAAYEDCPKERKQASPLKVSELLQLHAIVEEGTDVWDSILAGAALLCCYCRGRWGDLMRSETAFLDYDETGNAAFLETRTGRHKTMASQMHRHQHLPMVAPVKGVNGKDWATPWVRMREKLQNFRWKQVSVAVGCVDSWSLTWPRSQMWIAGSAATASSVPCFLLLPREVYRFQIV